MSVLYPDLRLQRASELHDEQLSFWRVNTLVLDVDNTLTTHNNPVPDQDILRWLEQMKQAQYRLVILSNNSAERVEPFARLLGLDYTANAMKPLAKGFRETARRLGVTAPEMAVVGDQIFTDILGGNLFGARTVLVEPMEPEKSWPFRLKRRLEHGILENYDKRKGKNT